MLAAVEQKFQRVRQVMEWETLLCHVSGQATHTILPLSHLTQCHAPSLSKCLLVVEDNEDIDMVLGDRLAVMGYEVLKATHWIEALHRLAMVLVAGVLLSIEVPVSGRFTPLGDLHINFV